MVSPYARYDLAEDRHLEQLSMDNNSVNVIHLPRKQPPSVIRFCRKLRLSRQDQCEN